MKQTKCYIGLLFILFSCFTTLISCGDEDPEPDRQEQSEKHGQDGNKEESNNKAPKEVVAVDLGLPSKTLWANMNVGASKPEDYGEYFAWGETSPKSVYRWMTYKWSNGSYSSITKYCPKGDYGTMDTRKQLTTEDDAAYVNWGKEWRTPSQSQYNELRTKCDWVWTRQNGVNGCLVIGPNDNSIFLPASGYCGIYLQDNQEIYKNKWWIGESGHYWSRTLYTDDARMAISIYFLDEGMGESHYYNRPEGLSIRPVRNQ